jgi:uncharacterized OB-fold protein
MSEFPQPEINETNKPFWDGLKKGELLFQECANSHRWLPASDFCPHCLSTIFQFKKASGNGKLISWVIYNQAHHPAFEKHTPYNVAIIELDEGPRMITNILCAKEELIPEMKLILKIEETRGLFLPKFLPQ